MSEPIRKDAIKLFFDVFTLKNLREGDYIAEYSVYILFVLAHLHRQFSTVQLHCKGTRRWH